MKVEIFVYFSQAEFGTVITYKNSIVQIYVDKPENSHSFGLFLGAKLFSAS